MSLPLIEGMKDARAKQGGGRPQGLLPICTRVRPSGSGGHLSGDRVGLGWRQADDLTTTSAVDRAGVLMTIDGGAGSDGHRLAGQAASQPDLPGPPGGGEPSCLSRADLAKLFRSEQPSLARAVRRRIGDADEAADLVQDAFARLLQARPAAALRAPKAYLQRIISNLLRDRYKRAENRFLVRTAEGAEPALAVVPPEQTWAIEAKDLMTAYAAAVAALTPRTREVFLMHRVEELRYREIAERLGITVATVEYHMARALAQLDEALDR